MEGPTVAVEARHSALGVYTYDDNGRQILPVEVEATPLRRIAV